MGVAKPEQMITILIVEDIAEIRANFKKILGFEQDFEVVGMAATGREGLLLAQEMRPDIILMDINMPDVDGLQITRQIMDALPGTGIIIMTAQDDPSYMRLAMMAGAKAFLTKPSSPDELYNTVRAVYRRARAPVIQSSSNYVNPVKSSENGNNRAGNIVVVYSPQGGAGCTTLATNLASALTRQDVRVLLVDANLQFADVGVFLNLEARSTLVDLVEDVEDLDTEYFENVVTTHTSGLKVLMGPSRPELAEKVAADPNAIAKILGKIRGSYDFIVIDTSLHLDDMALSLMDIATRIIIISTPTLPSVKNVRFVLDLFDQLNYSPDKMMLILNRVSENQNIRKLAITPDKVQLFLKRPIVAMIPTDEYMMLDAIRRGIPAVALERDRSKSVIKEILGLSDLILSALMPEVPEDPRNLKGFKTPAKMGSRKRVEHES